MQSAVGPIEVAKILLTPAGLKGGARASNHHPSLGGSSASRQCSRKYVLQTSAAVRRHLPRLHADRDSERSPHNLYTRTWMRPLSQRPEANSNMLRCAPLGGAAGLCARAPALGNRTQQGSATHRSWVVATCTPLRRTCANRMQTLPTCALECQGLCASAVVQQPQQP